MTKYSKLEILQSHPLSRLYILRAIFYFLTLEEGSKDYQLKRLGPLRLQAVQGLFTIGKSRTIPSLLSTPIVEKSDLTKLVRLF